MRSRRELKAFTFRNLRSALTKRFLRLVAFLASLRFCRMALRRSACWPLSFCNSSFKTSWPVMRTPKWSPFWSHNSEAPKQGLPGTCANCHMPSRHWKQLMPHCSKQNSLQASSTNKTAEPSARLLPQQSTHPCRSSSQCNRTCSYKPTATAYASECSTPPYRGPQHS